MLLIPCPHCGPRAEIEFRYAGEAHLIRPGADCNEQEWSEYLYVRDNRRGEHAERWRHIHGCGMFFNVIRDTATDQIAESYAAGGERPTGGSVI